MSGRNGHKGASRTRRVLQRVGTKRLPDKPLSDNAVAIKRLMVSRALKGNPKNYVVIMGSKILDHGGTYNALLSEGGEVIGDDVLLIHKRDLAGIIGDKAALRFWDPLTGRVDAEKDPEPDDDDDADA
ncbi:hypothetical protein LCGC14_1197770 [marine sediment metagenome]|uniref:Uncharacterized protein n=1 Tax=marine sediment metagenome TaxID=412755 RepID=A0A0F9P092_9ZZZZ